MVNVNAAPTKSFFVEMLTRDIELGDAILDLLDNCVDGVQRSIGDQAHSTLPYEGFWAKIDFSQSQFKIADNCGGISRKIAERYAFRMGRPPVALEEDNDFFTIGTYGIGMKRAMFKMGSLCTVTSQTDSESFKVEISPEWLSSDEDWRLSLEDLENPLEETGTVITVQDIRKGIASKFSEGSPLEDDLVGKIKHHYSYILAKGFKVYINGTVVPEAPLSLLWEGSDSIDSKESIAIAPYLFKCHRDGVDVSLAVGFYREIPDSNEIDENINGRRKRSSDTAGWTVICNDRVVVYCDKSRLTGWGEATVPSYHPQFIGISGIVHFRSKEAKNLPITTTKRGIDASSELYLFVKDFMREGLKVFTSYTNKWKKQIPQEREQIKRAVPAIPSKIFEEISESVWTEVRKGSRPDKPLESARKYAPKLPEPPKSQPENRRISFSRSTKQISLVSDFLFEDKERSPSEVGEACFDRALEEAE